MQEAEEDSFQTNSNVLSYVSYFIIGDYITKKNMLQ